MRFNQKAKPAIPAARRHISLLLFAAALLSWSWQPALAQQNLFVAGPFTQAVVDNNVNGVLNALARGGLVNGIATTRRPYIVEAARHGSMDVLKLLVERGGNVDLKDELGITALIWAASLDKPEIAAFLIKKKADVNAADKQGQTALMKAARYGRTEIVKLLIKNGADVSIGDYAGVTAIDWARRARRNRIVEILKAANKS